MKPSKLTIPCEIDNCNGEADRTLERKSDRPDQYECKKCGIVFDHDCRTAKNYSYYKEVDFYNGITEDLYKCTICNGIWIDRVLGVEENGI